ADRIPVHARPPQCMAWQVGVALVAEGLAVDLEIGAGAPLLSPQRVVTEGGVLGIEVSLPQRGRLDDMAVAVEHRKVFSCHSCPLSHAEGLSATPSFPRKREPRGEARCGCPGSPLARGRRSRSCANSE